MCTVIRQRQLDCLDTHSLSAISSDEVAVVCGRPNKIQVFNIDRDTLNWQLEPSQVWFFTCSYQPRTKYEEGNVYHPHFEGKWEVLLSQVSVGPHVGIPSPFRNTSIH